MNIFNLIKCMRIRQWTKNILIFAALVFSNNANNLEFVLKSVYAFLIFSLCAGAVYIFNDIRDIKSDREHPAKRFRPLAAGTVSVRSGWLYMTVLSIISIVSAFRLHIGFGYIILLYIVLQIAYTYFLKKLVIVDVFAISFGFLLRVIAGAVVIDVVISNWILVCTFLLALFLALSKRRHEITLLTGNAAEHRTILQEYSPYLLDQMIGVVAPATLVAYIIFTLSEATIDKFGSMIITVPFVLYGIFRYLYLVHMKAKGGQPEEILLTDIPLQINIILYGIVVLGIIYF
jgi:4-hydroxybenzoate polyprenyltransferase